MTKVRKIKSFIYGCFVLMAMACVSLPAHALLLTDSMVFVGQNGGSAMLKLKNTAQQIEAYRLEWDELVMKPAGAKEMVDESVLSEFGVNAASPYMYVAPRRLLLQPGQLQNIRFLLRRNNNLAPGEYRSYIRISPEEVPANFNPQDPDASQPGSGQAAELTMLTGYRIPVFFLHGDTTLDVGFSNVRMAKKDDRDMVSFTVNRNGSRSALGVVEILCKKTDGSSVSLNRGKVRIFSEIESRDFDRYITMPVGGCAEISLNFRLHDKDPAFDNGYFASAIVPR